MKTVLIYLLAFGSLNAFSQSYQLGHTTMTFNDPGRTGGFGSGGGSGRQIQSEVYYPTDVAGEDVEVASGEFPVVIFGHGFGMSWDAYDNIWTELVPHGFIVVFPRTESGVFPFPSHEDFGLDMALAETRMDAEDLLTTSLFYNHISGKSALIGHSMGGGATFLAAENNTSITTVIGLAPAETTPSAIDAAANVSVPALVLTADEDMVTPTADSHLPIYTDLGSTCKYFVNIIGGAHCYYANSNFNCDFGESTSGGNITISRQDQQDVMFRYILPWLKLYLYDDCDQHAVFETDLALDTEVTFQSSCTGFPNPTYNLNVSISTNTLTSDESGTTYQWVDCDNGNNEIVGATSQSYTASESGSYAVVLGGGTCEEMSDCYDVVLLGIENLTTPNSDKTIIKVVDVLGRETEFKTNTPLIYFYSDGSKERIFVVAE